MNRNSAIKLWLFIAILFVLLACVSYYLAKLFYGRVLQPEEQSPRSASGSATAGRPVGTSANIHTVDAVKRQVEDINKIQREQFEALENK